MYNRDKIREKLEKLNGNQTKTTKSGDGIKDKWKPTVGKQSQVRLFANPFNNDPDEPFMELWFHYDIGGKTILCLEKNFGKICPVCEEGRKLWKSGNAKDKEYAKKMFAKQRFHAYVIDREDNPLTPRIWGFGVTIYKQLMKSLCDDDECNFLNPDNGIDAIVETSKDPKKDYTDTTFKLKRNNSRLAGTDEEIKRIMSITKPIFEVHRPMTDVQIRKAIEDWLSFGPDEKVPEGIQEETTRKSTPKPETADTIDIDKAFDTALLDDELKDI